MLDIFPEIWLDIGQNFTLLPYLNPDIFIPWHNISQDIWSDIIFIFSYRFDLTLVIIILHFITWFLTSSPTDLTFHLTFDLISTSITSYRFDLKLDILIFYYHLTPDIFTNLPNISYDIWSDKMLDILP